jgi:hypothetical protein
MAAVLLRMARLDTLDGNAEPQPPHSEPTQVEETKVSQIIQDFGAGSLLLWPLLKMGEDVDKSWSDPPLFRGNSLRSRMGCALRSFQADSS